MLLHTKVLMPKLPRTIVSRARLIDKLESGLEGGAVLSLIQAPAGSGKSSLAAQWLQGHAGSTAWYSLDVDDIDVRSFLSYMVLAFGEIDRNLFRHIESLIHTEAEPSSILVLMANGLVATRRPWILVLEDYQLVESPEIHDAVRFLIEKFPPNFHLVMTTRTTPPLDILRLRAKGRLTEVGAADLAFNAEEVGAFFRLFTDTMLDRGEAEAIRASTEGWVTALQLMGISRRRGNAPAFGETTPAGRDIYDYLVQEVLDQQSDRIQEFLLCTSILDSFDASLAAAVSEDNRAELILEDLRKADLFLITLDEAEGWHRYHHLFREALAARLALRGNAAVARLHDRASCWFEGAGRLIPALEHALESGDVGRSCDQLVRVYPEVDSSPRTTWWLNCAARLPDSEVRSRPQLCSARAWANINKGNMIEAESWLSAVETGSQDLSPSMKATLGSARAYIAISLGDPATCVEHAESVVAIGKDLDIQETEAARSLLGLASLALGDLVKAESALSTLLGDMTDHNQFSDSVSLQFPVAMIQVKLGKISSARWKLKTTLKALEQRDTVELATPDILRGLADLELECGNVDLAEEYCARAEIEGRTTHLIGWDHRLAVSQAMIAEFLGDLSKAEDCLQRAAAVYLQTPVPDLYSIDALRIRLLLNRDKPALALSSLETAGISLESEPCAAREYEYILLARSLLWKPGRPNPELPALLDKLADASLSGKRIPSQIEVGILKALFNLRSNDTARISEHLAAAVALADPEVLARVFLDYLAPFDGRIESFFEEHMPKSQIFQVISRKTSSQSDVALTEPLSRREREVLQALATELSGPEIADRMAISLNTLRTHSKSIFAKLGVSSRRSAVVRARELGLL